MKNYFFILIVVLGLGSCRTDKITRISTISDDFDYQNKLEEIRLLKKEEGCSIIHYYSSLYMMDYLFVLDSASRVSVYKGNIWGIYYSPNKSSYKKPMVFQFLSSNFDEIRNDSVSHLINGTYHYESGSDWFHVECYFENDSLIVGGPYSRINPCQPINEFLAHLNQDLLLFESDKFGWVTLVNNTKRKTFKK